MKKGFVAIIPIIMIIVGCTSSAETVAVDTGGITLDQAIKEASTEIDGRFEANSKIALVNFNSSADQFSAYVLDELTANLVNSRHLEVIDRQEIDLRREEFNFQFSGEVDDNSIQELGRTLGAQNIVSGSLTSIGNTYRIVIRALNVESGRVEVQYRQDIANDSRVQALLAGGKTASASGGNTGGTAQATAQTYKVGDTGPAGGLVFYDKGNSQGGWRYMEAAPVETEKSLIWSDSGNSNIGLTFNGNGGGKAGNGKSNTEKLMEFAADNGGGFGWAVQYCDTLEVNGFDDWFLPSWDELNYMYGNLYMRELGGFKSQAYWSSTESGLGLRNVLTINFETGKKEDVNSISRWNTKLLVRAARQF